MAEGTHVPDVRVAPPAHAHSSAVAEAVAAPAEPAVGPAVGPEASAGTLPPKAPTAGSVTPLPVASSATSARTPPGILLADAFPLSRCQLASFLQQAGLPVVAMAGTGDEAEVLARVLRPAVAVVALGVAGLGWEMPRRLKAAAPGVRVVLLTTVHGSQTASYRVAAMRAGADACVANTALDELTATIREQVGGHTDP